MNRVITRTVVAASILLLLAVPTQSASAAPSEGAACSALWKSVKVGKLKLQCADAATGNAWIRVTATPKSAADANEVLAAWASALGIEGQAEMEAAVAGSTTLQDQLTIAQQQRDANAKILNDQTGRMNALTQEIEGLPNAVSTALSATKSAEATLETPKQAYWAAQSAVTSLSGSYQSALNSQYANVAGSILCMFGYSSCSSRPSSTSSYNSSIITQYNSASARLAGAKATYDSYFADYKAKYDKYKAFVDRQSAAQNELADANAKIAGARGASDGLEVTLSTAHTRMNTIATLASQLAAFTASSTSLTASLAPEAIQAAADWKTYFAQQAVAMGKHVVIRKTLGSTWQKYVTGA